MTCCMFESNMSNSFNRRCCDLFRSVEREASFGGMMRFL